MRTARALMVLGGMAVLIALPPEDLARAWSAAADVSKRATVSIVSFVRTQLAERGVSRPVEPARTLAAEAGSRQVAEVRSPELPMRPSIVSDDVRRALQSISVPDVSASRAEPVAVAVAATDPAPVTAAPAVDPLPPSAPTTDGAGASSLVSPPPLPETAPPPSAKPATATSPEDDDRDPADRASEQMSVPPAPEQKPETEEKKPPVAAKLLFGAARNSAPLAARAIGFYSRGCLAGAKALPVDGAAWQAMRLSRNRNWGHPKLVALIERFAEEVQKEDGWPGLLVGDMSQPRGGPMLTGHSSHQIGLDADIWFTPMPSRRLSKREREDLSATSMIDGPLKVDTTAFTSSHVKVVKRAARYRDVERILVHPAIKKALCEAAGSDRSWLSKVRPYFGHHYHFHIRMACPAGSENCRAQNPTGADDGCGKELDDWFARLTRPPKPKPPGYKPPPPKPPITLADLPQECRVVLGAGDAEEVQDEAELIKSSIERSKKIIDISGRPRGEIMPQAAR